MTTILKKEQTTNIIPCIQYFKDNNRISQITVNKDFMRIMSIQFIKITRPNIEKSNL